MLRHLLGERPVGRPGEEQQLSARKREVRHPEPHKLAAKVLAAKGLALRAYLTAD